MFVGSSALFRPLSLGHKMYKVNCAVSHILVLFQTVAATASIEKIGNLVDILATVVNSWEILEVIFLRLCFIEIVFPKN